MKLDLVGDTRVEESLRQGLYIRCSAVDGLQQVEVEFESPEQESSQGLLKQNSDQIQNSPH